MAETATLERQPTGTEWAADRIIPMSPLEIQRLGRSAVTDRTTELLRSVLKHRQRVLLRFLIRYQHHSAPFERTVAALADLSHPNPRRTDPQDPGRLLRAGIMLCFAEQAQTC